MKKTCCVPQISDCAETGEWYHGSPERLSIIRPGSTITRNRTLAMAFSHKPNHVCIEVMVNEESGLRAITLKQDGTRKGYLYHVIPDNSETDTREDPESVMFPGDEVLTTRELRVELLEEVPLRDEYIFHIF
ncbi:MAG: hypothetical protein K8S62_15420 [Candidatus Sabulitectum sp.]|nr:hypothetical protein [Candidatus Sabulitectum sp.]